jgi:hypothetical protein
MEEQTLEKLIITMAKESDDPINFMYELEQIVLKLTENWDWVEGD